MFERLLPCRIFRYVGAEPFDVVMLDGKEKKIMPDETVKVSSQGMIGPALADAIKRGVFVDITDLLDKMAGN